jgi:hypothetical protein
MASDTVNAILQLLSQCTIQEQRDINNMLVDKIKHHFKMQAVMATGAFNVGDKVWWMHKGGVRYEGVVTKIKTKNIAVDAGIHGRWIVTATLLKKLV